MKRRLMFWMVLVFAPTLLLISWAVSQRSFDLAMQREQERALISEALIAPQVKRNIEKLDYDGIVQAARQYRQAYGAQGIELVFCYNGIPIGGAQLPNGNYSAMLAVRSIMLDTLSRPERLAIAEPLTDRVTLLVLRDVSDLYEMRSHMRRVFLLAGLLGSLVMVIMSWIFASRFTKPVAQLTAAAQTMARGGAGESLPTGRRDELGTLARSFADMQRAVQSREESLIEEAQNRQLMLEALAHEMRTPLCSLLGNVRFLQMPTEEKLRAEITEDMAHEIKRLTDMDQKLMKLNRLSNEPIEMEDVEVLPLLRETVKRLGPTAEGIQLRVEGENVLIRGDHDLLALLADNLTVNALRASAPGQTVVLKATAHGFQVCDEGLGMTEEQLGHLFEPFYKADKARTRKHGGAGLGLTLCKKIVELHGGELTYESEVNRGTTATVTTWLHPVADSVTQFDVPCHQEVSHS